MEFCSYLFTAWAERVPTLHITPHELTVKHDDHEGYKEHEEERTMTTVSRCLTHRRSRAGPRASARSAARQAAVLVPFFVLFVRSVFFVTAVGAFSVRSFARAKHALLFLHTKRTRYSVHWKLRIDPWFIL